MTKLEALRSLIQYEWTDLDLFNKILTDHGVTSGATYAAGDREEIDLCHVDLLIHLADHPEVKDGQNSANGSGYEARKYSFL